MSGLFWGILLALGVIAWILGRIEDAIKDQNKRSDTALIIALDRIDNHLDSIDRRLRDIGDDTNTIRHNHRSEIINSPSQ